MKSYNKTVCILGLGYIGLPTAALLANKGYSVIGVDKKKSIVENISNGKAHISEPDLDVFVKNGVKNGRLKALMKPVESDIYIICVPTPFSKKGKIPTPDMIYVQEAAESFSALLKEGDLVILESTSPVGSTEKIKLNFEKEGIDINKISIAYCPERVLPGNILKELTSNDRIVGGVNAESSKVAAEFYESFVDGHVFKTNANTAEMCKLAENSYRDVNIAFANELSILCDNFDIDVWNLIELANRHPRVNILQPGTGVGGHCIAVDPWFLVSGDPKNSHLIKSAREINDKKTEWVLRKIYKTIGYMDAHEKSQLKIACLGISFKPDSDDLRGSPALKVARELNKSGLNIEVVEPNIDSSDEFKLISFETSLKADLIIVLVKHKEFFSSKNLKKMHQKKILDFCGIGVKNK